MHRCSNQWASRRVCPYDVVITMARGGSATVHDVWSPGLTNPHGRWVITIVGGESATVLGKSLSPSMISTGHGARRRVGTHWCHQLAPIYTITTILFWLPQLTAHLDGGKRSNFSCILKAEKNSCSADCIYHATAYGYCSPRGKIIIYGLRLLLMVQLPRNFDDVAHPPTEMCNCAQCHGLVC